MQQQIMKKKQKNKLVGVYFGRQLAEALTGFCKDSQAYIPRNT